MLSRALLLLCVSWSLVGCRLTEQRLARDFAGFRVPALRVHVQEETTLRYVELAQDSVPVVMFIHGTPGGLDNFIGFFKDTLFTDDFHLLSVDRPGFGGSQKGTYVPLAEQSKRLATLLEPHATRTILLVGHSYGGPVALQMAVDFPALIQGVVLLAPAIDPAYEAPRWFNYMGYVGMIRPFLPLFVRVTNDELLTLKFELERLAPQLKRMQLPIYYLHGTDDIFVSFGNTAYAQKTFSDITVQVLEDTHHFIPWTHPEEVKKGLYHLKERPMP